jgi:osmotically-inducible protein OsmY
VDRHHGLPTGRGATDPSGRNDVDLHVQEALARSAVVADDSDVKVATDGSVITLTGHVRTWAEHDAVIDAAWMARGVVDVDDELHITG